MASKKPAMILLSKTDMCKEEVAAISDPEAWKIIYSIRSVRAKDNRLQVCFTGFGATKKQELSELAQKKNFKVNSSVTKRLDFLVGGENAGPKKIEKAEAQGVQFLSEWQFKQLIDTGEVPSSS